MKLNDALIPHYRCAKIPIYELKSMVSINEDYLKEKPTWYNIDDKLKYFKIRSDYRLFTEQFFSKFGRQIIGLDTVDYQVACVRTLDPKIPASREDKKIGLLSENFQDKNFNYYLVSELLNSEISNLRSYNGYSLKSLLSFFKQTLANEDYDKCKEFLIKLFIADAFTMQLDRNPNNIGFQVPKVSGVSYKQRLRPELLYKHDCASQLLVSEDSVIKLKNFKPSKVYDNERILGVDHKKVFLHKKGDVWNPIFPYSQELLFETQQQAQQCQNEIYDGLDPNLTELFINYPESRSLIERLAYDDEYRQVIEQFSKPNSQISLINSTKDYFDEFFEERRSVFKKVLKL